MNTKTALTWVVAVVVAAGAWYLFTYGPWRVPASPASVQEQHILAGTLTRSGDLEYKEEGETYVVEALYSAKTPLQDSVVDHRARMVMEEALLQAIADFKESVDPSQLSSTELELAREQKYTLDITYTPYTSGNFVSYVFILSSDTGGAHPNAFFRTFTFNERGEEVALAGLFRANVRYLDKISAEAYTQVLAQLKERTGAEVTADMEDTVRIGTSPTPETLQFFYLSGEVLHIIIPPYQAAAYAAGSFDVSIPLSQLGDILK